VLPTAKLAEHPCVAGVGNHLRSEILCVARLPPDARPGELDAAQQRRAGSGQNACHTASIGTSSSIDPMPIARAAERRGVCSATAEISGTLPGSTD